jgi:hypothetical protein
VTNLVFILDNYRNEDSSWFAADLIGNLGTNGISALPSLLRGLSYKGSSEAFKNVFAEHCAQAIFTLAKHTRNLKRELLPFVVPFPPFYGHT